MTIFGEEHFLDSEMCSIAKEVDSTIIDEMYKTTVKIGVSVDKDKLRRWLLLCEQLENIDKSELVDIAIKRKLDEKDYKTAILEEAYKRACKFLELVITLNAIPINIKDFTKHFIDQVEEEFKK